MQNLTLASIIELLQSNAIPCSTVWDLHDLLQLSATIEEQRPLDLEATCSGEAEYSISGKLPSVTTRTVGRSHSTLEGFLPENTVFL